jgi:hypothetical protein
MLKTPSTELGTHNMVGAFFLWSTSYFQCQKQEDEHNKNCSNFVHGDLGMVQNIFFAFSLLLLALKVKG